ncbi:hypothetical protein AMR72_04505 [Flavobacterium psychrophilum]|nr:hypothetical protein AMR72_04505 [Flavobacterium psychrophilum]AOE51843.1 hypothetical protein ALW18_04500 [Flavobacterium psychrophilum]
MNPKYNHYKITLEHTFSPKEEDLNPAVVLEFDNHDEIFAIITRLQEKNHFDDADQSAQFAIGLKIFSEVMLKNKNNNLFSEFLPEFKNFMTKLKSN